MSRFILDPSQQGTPEWFASRCGKATSSKAHCIDAKNRAGTGEGLTRRDYRIQLVSERLTGEVQDGDYQSPDMKAGKQNEPMGRLTYAAETGALVREAGFAYLPDLAAGASVDGFIEDDPEGLGVLEIKCPKSANHIAYLQAKRLPPEYVDQTTHEVWVTGAAFVDFVSFDPRWPEKLQLFVIRVYAKELDLAGHEAAVRKFLGEVDALEASLRKMAA